MVPVEFLRQSSRGRVTLVLSASTISVPSLWSFMAAATVDEAINALKWREDPERGKAAVESWETGAPVPVLIEDLPSWAAEKAVDAVVWTALGPKFADERGRKPSIDEVISYLKSRKGDQRAAAEQYVRFTPRQIVTPYRQRIEAELDWTPRDPPHRRRIRRRKR